MHSVKDKKLEHEKSSQGVTKWPRKWDNVKEEVCVCGVLVPVLSHIIGLCHKFSILTVPTPVGPRVAQIRVITLLEGSLWWQT
jgi:hypothetical protein